MSLLVLCGFSSVCSHPLYFDSLKQLLLLSCILLFSVVAVQPSYLTLVHQILFV